MFPKINPGQMAGMMKKMGISSEQLNAKRVIIETPDKKIVIENPNVMCVKMQGNISYQISGEEKVEEEKSFSDEDVKVVIEKTGKTEKEVLEALEKTNGEIAEAIILLQEE